MHLESHTPIYEKESQKQIAPASTTKMLTALTAVDYCSMEEVVTVGEEIGLIPSDSSRAWLSAGNQLTFKQLLVAMLLPSGNDAAYTIAVHTGRKIEQDISLPIEDAVSSFTEAMNKRPGKSALPLQTSYGRTVTIQKASIPPVKIWQKLQQTVWKMPPWQKSWAHLGFPIPGQTAGK